MSRGPGADTGEEIPSQYQEEEDLKVQFQHQQEKLTQLKELLKQNEQKLVNKEKQVEVHKNSFLHNY
jgi:hypothetical protein